MRSAPPAPPSTISSSSSIYGIYPNSEKILSDLNIKLHHLCTWWDVLDYAKTCGQFDPIKLGEIEKFLHDPAGWSKAHGGVAQTAAE